MDFLQTPDDKIETDPPDLRPLFMAVMDAGLAQQIAADSGEPWTTQHAVEQQERISALVAAARAKGLSEFNVIVTRPNGTQAVARMDVAKIAQGRTLQ